MTAQHAEHAKHARPHAEHGRMTANHYIRLLVMVLLSFACMYVLMYAMVNAFENVFNNINQFYMAGLMAAPMAIIEIALMSAMYHNKKLNIAILGASVAALVAFWFLIRQQGAVDDTQFLRSMIPHHAGAILMCEEADITDPRIKALCDSIKTSQQSEIDQMKGLLKELAAK